MMNKEISKPTVTIVTPLYNSSAFVRDTLDSVLKQTISNWEIILVDDGSTDDTSQVIEPYLKDKRFRYFRQENQGIAAARNSGLRAATGEWICLLDHDDRWLPTKLEKQLQYALAHGCDILCTDAFIVDSAQRWVYSRNFSDVAAAVQRSVDDQTVDVFGLLISVNFICTCSVMLRRSLFEEHGLLDPDSVPADDYDMWLRCMPEAKLGFLREPLVEYSVHESNYSRDLVRLLDKLIYVLKKHRRRHVANKRRVRQFDDAIFFYYKRLFTILKGDPKYGLCRRAGAVLIRCPGVARVISKEIGNRLSARARASIRYRFSGNLGKIYKVITLKTKSG